MLYHGNPPVESGLGACLCYVRVISPEGPGFKSRLPDLQPVVFPIDSLRLPGQVAAMEQTRDALPGAWARLKLDVSCGLRRGAWYRVVGLTPEDAVLQVPRRERVRVPRRYLQTLFARPRHWTL